MNSNYIPGANEEEKRLLMAAIVKFVPDKCSICGEEMIKRSENGLGSATIPSYIRLENGEFCHLECFVKGIQDEVEKQTEAAVGRLKGEKSQKKENESVEG